MTLERKLLDILVCPITKQSVNMLDADRLETLNQLIEKGDIQSHDGSKVEHPLGQALITQNGSTIYPIEQQIPIMLEDRSISWDQVDRQAGNG